MATGSSQCGSKTWGSVPVVPSLSAPAPRKPYPAMPGPPPPCRGIHEWDAPPRRPPGAVAGAATHSKDRRARDFLPSAAGTTHLT